MEGRGGEGRGKQLRREGGGARCAHSMHGRCRMAIDSSIPTMPERSTSGFYRPGIQCWAGGGGCFQQECVAG